MVTVPACDFHPCESWPSSLHIYFFHTGASFLIRLLYPKTSFVFSQWVWCDVGSTVIVSVSGSTCMSWSSRWWIVFSFVPSIGKPVGWLLNVVVWCIFCVLDWLLYYHNFVCYGYSLGSPCKVVPCFMLVSHGYAVVVGFFWIDLVSFWLVVILLGAPVENSLGVTFFNWV